MQLNFAMTTVPTIVLWIVGLLIFGVGSLLGYFNMNIEAKKKLEAMETKSEILRAEAEKKLAEAERKLEEARMLHPHAETDPGILRVKRDGGVELDGAALKGALTAEKKKRLIDVVSYLRPFLDAPAQAAQPQPVPTATPTPAPISPVVSQPTVTKPAPSLLNAVLPAKKKDSETEFKLLSIVQQIDTVLQKRLEGTAFEKAGIRLHDSPQGGVEVFIGVEKFESIDDVPDPAIKTIIRAAVAEWEQKYTPGL